MDNGEIQAGIPQKGSLKEDRGHSIVYETLQIINSKHKEQRLVESSLTNSSLTFKKLSRDTVKLNNIGSIREDALYPITPPVPQSLQL